MKRLNKLVCIFFLLLTIYQIGAKSISVEGYGNSAEDARYNASLELNRYINGEYINSLTEVSSMDSGNGIIDEYFSDSISIATEGELIGVEYSDAIFISDVSSKNGRYKVIATISDSLLNVYVEKIQSSAKSIDAIYNQNSTTINGKKTRLLNLLSEIKKHDGYKQVAIFLGANNENIFDYNAPITYQSVHTELQSLLIEEEVELTTQKNNQKDIIVIAQIKAELEANRKEQEALKAQIETNAKIAEEMAIKNIENRVDSILANNFVEAGVSSFKNNKSLDVLVNNVISAAESWNSLYDEYTGLVAQEHERIENSLKAELAALKNKSYRMAELSNGQPTEEAKKFRDLEIRQLEEDKDNEKINVEALISEKFQERLKESYNVFLSNVEKLNNSELEASIKDGNLIYDLKPYDGNSYSWNVDLTLKLCLGTYAESSDKIDKPIITSEFKSGSYNVTIKSGTDGAVIFYTLDGSIPGIFSSVYSETLALGFGYTITARAYKNGIWSEPESYTITYNDVGLPVIRTATISDRESLVSIECSTRGAKIYYTLDGTIPTLSDTEYISEFIVNTGTRVTARAYKNKYSSHTSLLILPGEVCTPLITSEISNGSSAQSYLKKISIDCITEDAVIYYTTDNTEPNLNSKKYTGPFYISTGNIVKAKASYNDTWSSTVSFNTTTGVFKEEKENNFIYHDFSLGEWSVVYKELSGEAPVKLPESISDKTSLDKYTQYADNVEVYNRLLENIENSPYDINVKYKLKYIVEKDQFYIELCAVSLQENSQTISELMSQRETRFLHLGGNLNLQSPPDWFVSSVNISSSYENIVKEIQKTKAKEERERKKTEFKDFLNNKVNMSVAFGLVFGYPDYSDEMEVTGSLRLPITVDVDQRFRVGIVPEVKFSDMFSFAGLLFEAELHSLTSFDSFDNPYSFGAGLDFGISGSTTFVRPYVNMKIDRYTLQIELDTISSRMSDLKSTLIGFSVKMDF